MIRELTIKNFKSIAADTIELGRVNVFIGENGCGKSNILEAVGFLSAARVSHNIDKDILFGKGVRIAKPSLTVSAFKGANGKEKEIEINALFDKETGFYLKAKPEKKDDASFTWLNNLGELDDTKASAAINHFYPNFTNVIKNIILNQTIKDAAIDIGKIQKSVENLIHPTIGKFAESYQHISDYIIYSLNTLNLRGLTQLSHKEPVGIYGENLDVLIANFDKEETAKLKHYNYLVSWLEDFFVDTNDILKLKGYKQNLSKSKLYFEDKYMLRKDSSNIFSSENANEGILHVLFYLAVLISKRTPKFFAIDNIESCLNPHLCRHLMTEVCKLAKETDKQLLITTHNPAILDGLNLHDDEVRLFVVSRMDNGHTKTRRVKFKPEANGEEFKLSELWTRGFLGAISDKF